MTQDHVVIVAALHAQRILDARHLEASAARYDGFGDTDRAEQCRDDAAQYRAQAAAIEALLRANGAQVLIPTKGQLSLFGDGQ